MISTPSRTQQWTRILFISLFQTISQILYRISMRIRHSADSQPLWSATCTGWISIVAFQVLLVSPELLFNMWTLNTLRVTAAGRISETANWFESQDLIWCCDLCCHGNHFICFSNGGNVAGLALWWFFISNSFAYLLLNPLTPQYLSPPIIDVIEVDSNVDVVSIAALCILWMR